MLIDEKICAIIDAAATNDKKLLSVGEKPLQILAF